MSCLKSWEVELSVSGPVSINRSLSLSVEKGEENSFLTNVRLRKTSFGVSINFIALASTSHRANSAGVFFIGQMLDLLALWIDLPLYLGMTGTEIRNSASNVKRIIEEAEWKDAFIQSRVYGRVNPSYSRSLSWYRKGLISEDPIDKFLAFWSALEGVGSKNARRSKRTSEGAINQICDCFDQIWISAKTWKVIPNNAKWVNQFAETRNGISHGYISVDVETVSKITEQLPTLKALVHTFLIDWEEHLTDVST